MASSAHEHSRRWIPLAYGIAVVGSGLVVGTRLVPEGSFRSFFASILFLGAVSAAGAFGGWKPGFLTTALSACGAALFLVRPYYTFQLANTGDLLRIVGSVMAGIAISLLCEALHRAVAHRRSATAAARGASGTADRHGKHVGLDRPLQPRFEVSLGQQVVCRLDWASRRPNCRTPHRGDRRPPGV